jgi:DNA-binding response OmpR family regulator
LYQELNKRILILRDRSFDIESSKNDGNSSLKLSLENNGFAVDVFTDPFLALQTFNDNMYSMIIVMMNLTKTEAFELYYQFRNIDKTIRICFLDN